MDKSPAAFPASVTASASRLLVEFFCLSLTGSGGSAVPAALVSTVSTNSTLLRGLLQAA